MIETKAKIDKNKIKHHMEKFKLEGVWDKLEGVKSEISGTQEVLY